MVCIVLFVDDRIYDWIIDVFMDFRMFFYVNGLYKFVVEFEDVVLFVVVEILM